MNLSSLLTQLSRIIVGALFIFSGFIKANDPAGFGFKLEEYFEIFGTEFMMPFAMGLSIFICVFEVFLGILLLIGKWIKPTVFLLLAMIVFFSFLTFWSAFFDVVTDCGCFGDAIPLTPWESFTKDVILLVLILIILKGMKHIKPLFSDKISNNIVAVGLLTSLAFPLYTYRYLPVKDFRPYAIGNNVEELMKVPEGELASPIMEMLFIYKKDGQQYEFTMENLPENIADYEYVERIDKIIEEAYEPKVHDFTFTDMQGNDVTEAFLNKRTEYKLMTVQYDITKSDLDVQPKLEELTKELTSKGILVYNLTAAGKSQIEALNSTLNYQTMDRTTLKTIVRSNPGLVLFKGNTVVMKWPSTRFPSTKEVLSYIQD